MASKHIKLEILLVSIIIFILLTDYTLLLGHPSTRVGLITKNLKEKLRQRELQNLAAAYRSSARGRRLEATHYLRRQYSSNNPITVTKTPSAEVRLSSTVTVEFIPRPWLVDTVRKILYGSPDDRTAA
ncbi:hypothetical protein QTG54_003694 [Skeletonema marinoi]|uniref:Uncharacterized protein n=1 Tax=Skeletonema marinoi TaxID=267567 RepID=A0AAD9DH86_9STRA|nr:hypothetical protein QTG54_003694 [Skeletonema marinoi]